MVNRYLSDFVSTDAHDLNKRPIRLKRSYELIAKKTEEGYAEASGLKERTHCHIL